MHLHMARFGVVHRTHCTAACRASVHCAAAGGGLSAADEDFERDHDKLLANDLMAQVSEMKEIALDIGTEVRSHNKFLEGFVSV